MRSPFFPQLVRRAEYSVKQNGRYYEYGHYKQEIREDCLGRCVYCDSHENEVGGVECMEMDHFRPKKYPVHEHLVNDPRNLVWACRGCNRLKTSTWPALGLDVLIVNGEGFIDPFVDRLSDYFEIKADGELVPLKPAAHYLVTILALNRVSKRRIREMRLFAIMFTNEVDDKIQKMERILSGELSAEQRDDGKKVLEWLLHMKRDIISRLLDFNLL